MSDLIQGGFTLMVMGMGSVFVFLAILVVGTTVMSQIIMRMPSTQAIETSSASAKRSSNNNEDLAEIAAVAAAVKLIHKS